MNQMSERVIRLECAVEQLQNNNRRLKQGLLCLGGLLMLLVVLGAAGLAPSGTGTTRNDPLYVLPVDQDGDYCAQNGAVNITSIITDSRQGNRPYGEN